VVKLTQAGLSTAAMRGAQTRARQHFRRRSWHTRGGVWYRQTIVGIAAGLHLGHNAAAPRPDANAAERIVDVVDSNAAMRRSLAEAGLLRQNTVPFAVKRRFNFSNLHPTAGRMLVARSRNAGNGWSRSSSRCGSTAFAWATGSVKDRHRENRVAAWRKLTREE
jgi:hypothetical protein